MKEGSWHDCIEFGDAIKITPDKEKAKSLLETAEDRLKCSAKEINEESANFVFEDYYYSVVEIIHAIVLMDGYKVNNHVCLGHYLKEGLKRNDLFAIFDDIRYKRNSLTYYGKRMDFDTAKQAIEKSKRLIKELNSMIQIK